MLRRIRRTSWAAVLLSEISELLADSDALGGDAGDALRTLRKRQKRYVPRDVAEDFRGHEEMVAGGWSPRTVRRFLERHRKRGGEDVVFWRWPDYAGHWFDGVWGYTPARVAVGILAYEPQGGIAIDLTVLQLRLQAVNRCCRLAGFGPCLAELVFDRVPEVGDVTAEWTSPLRWRLAGSSPPPFSAHVTLKYDSEARSPAWSRTLDNPLGIEFVSADGWPRELMNIWAAVRRIAGQWKPVIRRQVDREAKRWGLTGSDAVWRFGGDVFDEPLIVMPAPPSKNSDSVDPLQPVPEPPPDVPIFKPSDYDRRLLATIRTSPTSHTITSLEASLGDRKKIGRSVDKLIREGFLSRIGKRPILLTDKGAGYLKD